MTKKKTTIEDLARMVQEGFTGIKHDFKREIKDEINGLEKRLTNRIDNLSDKIDGLELNLSANTSRTREDMEKFEDVTRNHEKRISRLEVRSRK